MTNRQKIRAILSKVRYVSMATVNKDGSPHSSPLVFLYDKNLENIFWGSHPDSQHSQNILRTGQAFFTAYDSQEGSIGLYIQTTEATIVQGDDLIAALEIHNHFRAQMGKNAINISYYTGESPQKMWRAKVEKVWINAYERREDGRLIKDYKIEISPTEVIGLWN